jgi:hypothetical protein
VVLGLIGAWLKRDHGALRFWLDSWSGVGRVAIGMARQGYDLQLTRYDERDWHANLFPVGIAHSIVGGSAWEPTPWRAVQRAASAETVWISSPR